LKKFKFIRVQIPSILIRLLILNICFHHMIHQLFRRNLSSCPSIWRHCIICEVWYYVFFYRQISFWALTCCFCFISDLICSVVTHVVSADVATAALWWRLQWELFILRNVLINLLVLQLNMIILNKLLNIRHRFFSKIKISIVIASLFIVFFDFLQSLLLS